MSLKIATLEQAGRKQSRKLALSKRLIESLRPSASGTRMVVHDSTFVFATNISGMANEIWHR